MKARGINGNGMGEPLTIAAQRLLPTTTAMDYKASGGAAGSPHVTLTDALVRGRGLLPTPRTSDTNGPGLHGAGGMDLRTAATMLPTPRATRGGSGTETMYKLGAERSDEHRTQGEVLLPTPRATDGPKGGPNQRGSSGDMMPPSAVQAVTTAWGPYVPAIRRWERVFGRPAPSPTEPNAKGNPRLSPKFTEWLMGVPEGWITGIPISRNEQLKACGNGVVPAQAAAALREMLAAFGEGG